MTETKIVELIIQDENQELAIDAISLVTSPAIEQDFVFFGKEKNNLTFAKVDEEKRMLVSPALIPEKTILRHDPQTSSDYFVFFSKATVRKASELYLKHNNHHKATYQHQDRVSGVLTVESWIKEGDSDKSKLYGYDLPNGTWFVKMKIENDELWQKIKAGELKGLSIEGYFTNKFEQMQKTKETTTEQILSAFNELVREGKITTMSKAKKVELKDMKTLKALESQLNKIVESLDSEGMKTKLTVADYEEKNQDEKLARNILNDEEEYIDTAKQQLKDQLKSYDRVEKTYNKARANQEKFAQKVFKSNDKYESTWNKGSTIAGKLETAIKEVQAAAKSLGVDIPVGIPRQTLATFKATNTTALQDLNFDY